MKRQRTLVGGVDEVSSYNYNLERLSGWYKKELVTGAGLYTYHTNGSIAGEGAAMFMVSNESEGAVAEVKSIQMLHTADPLEVADRLRILIKDAGMPDVFLSGENGDERVQPFYTACENVLPAEITKLHYKHFTGEHPSTSALALWLACKFLETQTVPAHFFKSGLSAAPVKNILMYNTGKGDSIVLFR